MVITVITTLPFGFSIRRLAWEPYSTSPLVCQALLPVLLNPLRAIRGKTKTQPGLEQQQPKVRKEEQGTKKAKSWVGSMSDSVPLQFEKARSGSHSNKNSLG